MAFLLVETPMLVLESELMPDDYLPTLDLRHHQVIHAEVVKMAHGLQAAGYEAAMGSA